MELSKFRLIISTIVLFVSLASLFFTSLWGSLATIITVAGIICGVLGAWKLGTQVAFFAIVPGFIGAFVDHPVDRRVAKVLEVAQQADMQPGDFLLPPGEKLAFRVMSACAMHNNAQALNIATDLTYARYEPAETGWFSWALKPNAEGGKCFSEADQLALRSQRFKAELAAIKAEAP